MRSRYIASLIGLTAMAAFVLPASALAASTTVTPAGDGFTLGSSTVNIDVPNAGVGGQCTMSGGTGKVPTSPSNHNASGPVTINLTANPKFTSCHWGNLGFPPYTQTMQVFAREVWSVALQGGSPTTGTLKIPSGGIFVDYAGVCEGENFAAASWSGKWTNGTTSPLVNSTMALAGSFKVNWLRSAFCTWTEANFPVEVSGATVSVTDTTNGTKVINVGS